VAMTRAKENLTIHLNGNYLDSISAESMVRIENENSFPPPRELALQLSHKEINLGYFEYIQHRINLLISGDVIKINGEGCINMKDELVLKFSRKFLERLEEIKATGFQLKSAKVNFIVYWKKEDSAQEIKIILPELYFER
ncbi:MAG: hypothetical protein ABIN24_03205, partial [Dyadobacter sp.]